MMRCRWYRNGHLKGLVDSTYSSIHLGNGQFV